MQHKPLSILFCGFRHGHIHSLYKKVQASDTFTVAGCIEPDGAARKQAEEKLGAVFSEIPYEAWLKTDIDAVAIGSAYGQRGELILKALKAGKHVLSDKPICTSMSELSEIRHFTGETGKKLGCMLDLRDLGQVQTASALLHSGRLGEIRNIAVNGQHCIDYAHRPAWYFEAGMHGGTINDLAIHGVDLIRMLTDMEITKIDRARVWNAYADRHPDFKDSALLMARLENGAGILMDVSYSAPPEVFSMPTYWEFRIWCERGLLTFSYTDPAVTLYEMGIKAPIRIEPKPCTRDYLSDFYQEIRENTDRLTRNVLISTETALRLQAAADQEVEP